jgi:hypothetical protein
MAIASIVCPAAGALAGHGIPTVAVALVQAGSDSAGKIGAIAGFFAMEAMCLAGLICGIAALVMIRRSGGTLGGQAAAIVGIILSAFFFLLPMVGLAIYLWHGIV